MTRRVRLLVGSLVCAAIGSCIASPHVASDVCVIADPPIITSGDSGPPWSGPGVGNGVRSIGGGTGAR